MQHHYSIWSRLLLSVILRWQAGYSIAYRAGSHFSIAEAQATLADLFHLLQFSLLWIPPWLLCSNTSNDSFFDLYEFRSLPCQY